MNLSQYLDPEHPYFFYLLGAIILLVYIVLSRRNLNKLQNNETVEQDGIVNEEEHVEGIKGHFRSLDKSLQWKMILLVVLMIIGLYLVVFKRGAF